MSFAITWVTFHRPAPAPRALIGWWHTGDLARTATAVQVYTQLGFAAAGKDLELPLLDGVRATLTGRDVLLYAGGGPLEVFEGAGRDEQLAEAAAADGRVGLLALPGDPNATSGGVAELLAGGRALCAQVGVSLRLPSSAGRNQPCSCGSPLKFKRCCGRAG